MKKIVKKVTLVLVGTTLLLLPHTQYGMFSSFFSSGEKKDEPGWLAKNMADILQKPIKALTKTIKEMGEKIPKSVDGNLKSATGQIIVSLEDIVLGKEEEKDDGSKVRAGGLDKKIETILADLGTGLNTQLDKSSKELIEKLWNPINEKLVTVGTMLKNINDELFGNEETKKIGLTKKAETVLESAQKSLDKINKDILTEENVKKINKTIKGLWRAGTKANEFLNNANSLIKEINNKIKPINQKINDTLDKYSALKDEVSKTLEEYKKVGQSTNNFINGVSGLWSAFLGTRELPWANTITTGVLGTAALTFFSAPLTSIILGLGGLAYYCATPLSKDIAKYTADKEQDPKAQFKFDQTGAFFNDHTFNLATWIGGGLVLGGLFKLIGR